jgi:thiol-disulfide isomerase/thioredoxin
LLVQEVAFEYAGRVTFVSENFGASALADRFGVKGYPAVFVDDIFVAAPREFGYFGEVEGAGRHAPWRKEANQAKFKSDLMRMIDLILAGKRDLVSSEHAATAAATRQLAALPSFRLTDLAGKPLTSDQLANRVVLGEFWATWCPPCRSTLEWLGKLERRHADKIAVVALAVESPKTRSARPSPRSTPISAGPLPIPPPPYRSATLQLSRPFFSSTARARPPASSTVLLPTFMSRSRKNWPRS